MKLSESSKRYILDEKNLSSMISLLDLIYDTIKKGFRKRSIFKLTEVDIETIDGTNYQLPVYIDPKLEGYAALGFDKEQELSTKNLALIVNPYMAKSKKNLYNSLYHEFLHAVDPTITSKPSKKYQSKYGDPTERPDLYYSHGIELRAITGEFFEALVNEFKERKKYIKDENDKLVLLNSLKNIVNFFVELESLSSLSYNILDEMSGENNLDNKFRLQMSNIFKEYPQTSEFVKDCPEKEPYFLIIIDLIRYYSPKGWKKFLTMLYSTSQEIKNFLD